MAQSSFLPRFWKSFQYNSVATTDATKFNLPLTTHPKVLDILRTRRVRIVAAILLPSILFVSWPYVRNNIQELMTDLPPALPPASQHDPSSTDTDWSRFAYTQYVTNTDYLCNSVMLFEILHRLGSKADRLMMYPSFFDPEKRPHSMEGRLLLKARDEYGVKLSAIEIQHKDEGDGTWADSYTKLLAFNQTQYDRVLNLDSDSIIQQTMDELFLLPPCPVAMPRAYWLEDKSLSSQIILIQPSHMEFTRIVEAINTPDIGFDMEIVNALYGGSAIVLPHRPYDLLTAEFRGEGHEKYMGNNVEAWDPEAALKESKFLHFSDWPYPKPWISAGSMTEERKPKCFLDPATGQKTDCRAQKLWLGFYSDFARRRKEICNLDLVGG